MRELLPETIKLWYYFIFKYFVNYIVFFSFTLIHGFVHWPCIGYGKKCSFCTTMEESKRGKEHCWWLVERNMPSLWCCPSRPRWWEAFSRNVLSEIKTCLQPCVACFLTIFPAGLPLSKRVLFYATFFHLYGSTCHQLQRKLRRI